MKQISSKGIKSSLMTMQKQGFLILVFFLLIVIASSATLIMVNFYTIKTLSAVRAFINGESEYSKAQKDGTHHLQLYLATLKESYYLKYKQDLKITMGDSLARAGFYNGEPEIIIGYNLIAARNHPEDVENMIWLVKSFQEIVFLKNSLSTWSKADLLIGKLDQKADSVHSLVSKHQEKKAKIADLQEDLEATNNSLTTLESEFSTNLGIAYRNIGQDLFYSNIAMTLLIIGAAGTYSALSIRKLLRSQADIYSQNQYLTETNKELDRFVYSASHDLRAPLTSLKGLLQIIKEEEDPKEVRNYLKLMSETLEKQDEFIKEIIDYSRNKRTNISIKRINFRDLLEEVFAQHQYLIGSTEISFQMELQVEEIYSDPLRLKIILNNLISNAIKYSDLNKVVRYVIVRTDATGSNVRIEVSDNGIGIEDKYLTRIFDMFFVTQHSNRGSGVGLYITKESIEKIKGTISVKSEPERGSTFTVILPANVKPENEELENNKHFKTHPAFKSRTWLN